MVPHKKALITGASSGIGEAFADALAKQGYALVLVARRKDRLKALADRLQRQHAVSIRPLVADLSRLEDIEKIAHHLSDEPADMLINNAGFGTGEAFYVAGMAKHTEMTNVHIGAPTALCRATIPGMRARGYGTIINVASIAAFLSETGSVMYCATKAYLVALSRGLQHELMDRGIRVQALCPGLTVTEFHDSLQNIRPPHTPRFLWRSPEEVVAVSLAALDRGKVVCIPGWENRLAKWLATNPLTSSFFAAAAKKSRLRRHL